jgi:photosystem II stability/assembly factor-like uncharacterized protein
MFTRLCRLRLLSVLLTLVLVAPPLGGRLWARPAAQPARSQTSGTTNNLFGVACRGPSTCSAVGVSTSGGMILRSTNGGSTWRSQTSGTTNDLHGVARPRPSTCVAVGNRGTLLRSTDGGSTWRSV